MISKKNLGLLKKQHYALVGRHSAVQICRWTKKSLLDEGFCHKQKFYGIKSHRCCQMSPWIACENKCLHCWRAIELNMNALINKEKLENPKEIIEQHIEQQKKLLTGFKGSSKTNLKKWHEAQEPSHFAISLVGEPTIYPYIGEMIEILRKKGKTTFLVTNGLHPEVLKKLEKKNQLPTQVYISLNSPNRKEYEKWHKSKLKDAWEKFCQSLEIMKELKDKTRTVLRMTLVRNLNMEKEQVKEYAGLIKKANPLFVEVKGFMSVGFARQRLGYEKMPNFKEVQDYAKNIAKASGYKVLDRHEYSRVILLGKSGRCMKIAAP